MLNLVWAITHNYQWCSGSALVSINEVNLRRARLVPGWVTVSGFNSRCRTFISVCNQPPRSIQPGHHIVGRRNEYQIKGGDALQLGSKGRYDSFVCDRYVWSHPLVTHGPYLSALEIHVWHCKALYKSTFFLLLLLLLLLLLGNRQYTWLG